MLSMLNGAAVAAGQEASTDVARFGSWGVNCASPRNARTSDAPPANRRCIISQIVAADPTARRVILGVTVDLFDSPDVPTIHFRLSPGAKKEAGIGLKIDDGPEFRLPIGSCDQARCEAAGRLTGDVRQAFLSGRVAQIAFIGPDGRQIVAPVALAGFREALEALRTDKTKM
jgi:invasion protein IalB